MCSSRFVQSHRSPCCFPMSLRLINKTELRHVRSYISVRHHSSNNVTKGMVRWTENKTPELPSGAYSSQIIVLPFYIYNLFMFMYCG